MPFLFVMAQEKCCRATFSSPAAALLALVLAKSRALLCEPDLSDSDGAERFLGDFTDAIFAGYF